MADTVSVLALQQRVTALEARVEQLIREPVLVRTEALKVDPDEVLVLTIPESESIEPEVLDRIKQHLRCKNVLAVPEGVQVGTKKE